MLGQVIKHENIWNTFWFHMKKVLMSCFSMVSNHMVASNLLHVPFKVLNKPRNLFFGYNQHQFRGEREFPFLSIPKNESLWFPFPNYGNGFFHSLPVPELWEWIFSFPSRSRIVGMDFFNSLPVPEFAISQTRIKTGIGVPWEIPGLQFFQLSLHFSKQLYWGGKLSQDVQKWVTEKTGHFAQFCCK